MAASFDYLPLEMTQMILRYAISVPIFLDPDALYARTTSTPPVLVMDNKTSDWCRENSYWEAERTRNRCRGVCKLWDAYLDRFANRYVRMSDILSFHVSYTALNQAIRLEIGREDDLSQNGSPWRDMKELVAERYESVEILTIELGQDGRGVVDLDILDGIFPNLVMLWTGHADVCQSVTFPSLRHLGALLGVESALDETTKEIYTLEAPHLRTLEMALDYDFWEKYEAGRMRWSFPRLESLKLLVDDWEEAIKVLRVIGSTLQTLIFDDDESPPGNPPSEIWELCPNLQCLAVGPPKDVPVECRIPKGHPMKTIYISPSPDILPPPVQPASFWPGWPDVTAVLFAERWGMEDEPHGIDTEWLEDLRPWMDSPVRLEDSEGLCFKDAMKDFYNYPDVARELDSLGFSKDGNLSLEGGSEPDDLERYRQPANPDSPHGVNPPLDQL